MPPMEGEARLEGTLLGRYRLDRFLGEGATSQVYLATHMQLGRKVAIKMLAPRLLLGREAMDRVIQEARIVNAIRHPNIAEVFDVLDSDAPLRMALVMEYVEGPSLGALSGAKLSLEQAVGVGLQLVSALQTTHAAGVIHRDLKPDNLLFTRDPRSEPARVPRLKIIDFGVAKLGSHGKTVAGRMVGTPAYMAPEQVAGSGTSPATDVFAVGEVLYELLSGERAFPQTTVQAVVRVKLRGPRPELEGLLPLPEAFQRKLIPLIHRCLALVPTDRPSLGELREALLELVEWRGASGPRQAREAISLIEPQTLPWLEGIRDDATGQMALEGSDGLRSHGSGSGTEVRKQPSGDLPPRRSPPPRLSDPDHLETQALEALPGLLDPRNGTTPVAPPPARPPAAATSALAPETPADMTQPFDAEVPELALPPVRVMRGGPSATRGGAAPSLDEPRPSAARGPRDLARRPPPPAQETGVLPGGLAALAASGDRIGSGGGETVLMGPGFGSGISAPPAPPAPPPPPPPVTSASAAPPEPPRPPSGDRALAAALAAPVLPPAVVSDARLDAAPATVAWQRTSAEMAAEQTEKPRPRPINAPVEPVRRSSGLPWAMVLAAVAAVLVGVAAVVALR